jgi:hypothetical protein
MQHAVIKAGSRLDSQVPCLSGRVWRLTIEQMSNYLYRGSRLIVLLFSEQLRPARLWSSSMDFRLVSLELMAFNAEIYLAIFRETRTGVLDYWAVHVAPQKIRDKLVRSTNNFLAPLCTNCVSEHLWQVSRTKDKRIQEGNLRSRTKPIR